MEKSLAICTPRPTAQVTGLTPSKLYEYMRDNLLICRDNTELLTTRVREIYFEVVEEMSDYAEKNAVAPFPYVPPSVASVAARADEENQAIIDRCCYDAKLLPMDIDHIEALYHHDIACMLDEWIGTVLWEIGLPVEDIYFVRAPMKQLPTVTHQINPDQIMSPFWEEWEQ